MNKISEETKSEIIRLWNDDHSAGQIATLLHMTRNSVIGIVYRARKNFEEGNVRKERKKKEKPPKKIMKNTKKIIIRPKKIKEQKVEKPKVYVEAQGNCTLDELKYNSCRFIVHEGNHETTKYCGQQIDRESYCSHHYSICYYPSRRSLELLLKRA